MAESLKVETGSLRADATAVCQTSQQLAGSIGTTVSAAIIAIWQKKPAVSYSLGTAQGSQAAFIFTLIILFSDWKMFKTENNN